MFYFNDPMPDCVPEYYRARQDSAGHRYELQAQRQVHFFTNREKINAANASGLPILSYGGYEPCWECPRADHDTMTGEDDDLELVICQDPTCPHHCRTEVSQ